MLAAPPAPAGTYTLTYSGTGQSVSVGVNVPGGTYTQPYSGGYGGGGSTSWSKPGNSVTCSGSITATATWQPSGPGDLPPASAIVQETGTASWTGTGIIVPTGQCDDGQHDAEVDTVTPPPHPGPPTSASGVSTGVHYWVKSNPGMSFTLTPGASASVSDQMTAGGGSASVSYTASVTPVTVSLTGPIQDSSGNYNILVGQSCTASLAGIPTTCTVSGWHWSVSGPTFQDWQPETPANGTTPFNEDASYYVGGSGPLTNSTAKWQWSEIGKNSSKNETITCTATVTPPTGQGAPFTVTATQTVNVWSPDWTCLSSGASVVVDNTFSPPDFWLHAGPGPLDFGVYRGMTWDATISAPTGSPILFGPGTLQIEQIVTGCDAGYTTDNAFPISFPYRLDGQTGSDGDWPYSWYTSSSTVGENSYQTGDSPGGDVSGDQSAHDNIAFEDYLMYLPPGSGRYVPVGKYIWSAAEGASIPNTDNWINFTGSAETVTDGHRTGTFVQSNEFPAWTQVVK